MSKKKFLIGLLILLCIIAIALFAPFFNVNEVVLHESGKRNSNFDAEKFDIKENFFLFSSSDYEEELLKTGLIDTVSVQKEFFCKLVLDIKWKSPLISLKSGDSNILLDNEGYVLYITDKKDAFGSIDGVIVKSARIGEPIITENDYLLENAVNIYLLILLNKNLFEKEALSPDISIKGDKIMQRINSSYYIDFGDGSQSELKFSKAITMYNELCRKEVTSGIINVSRKNHYVYETWKDY